MTDPAAKEGTVNHATKKQFCHLIKGSSNDV
jgi:hypothetical protein